MLRAQMEELIEIEKAAADIYFRSAEFFSGDEALSAFIGRLGKDEELHEQMLLGAFDALASVEPPPSLAHIEPEEMEQIKAKFSMLGSRLESGELTKRELLEFIADVEYSEWNDLFLYIIASLKMKNEFKRAAINIQKHKKAIEEFVSRNGPEQGFLERLKTLPRVWDEKVLAVDDDEIITDVIGAVLSGDASVDTAKNGVEALKKMESNYYAAIITDMDMPLMDGVSFYKEAVRLYPNIGKRFIFFSGSMRPEWGAFLGVNGLRFLKKPFSIKEIKSAVTEILSSE